MVVVDFVKTKAIAVTDGVTEECREVHNLGRRYKLKATGESRLLSGENNVRQHWIAALTLAVEKRQQAKVGARIKCCRQKKEEG